MTRHTTSASLTRHYLIDHFRKTHPACAASSINRKLAALTSFCEFHAPQRRRAITLSSSPPRPRVLTAAEAQAILDACVHLRGRFLFALLLNTGMRTSTSPNGRLLSSRGTTTTELGPRAAARGSSPPAAN